VEYKCFHKFIFFIRFSVLQQLKDKYGAGHVNSEKFQGYFRGCQLSIILAQIIRNCRMKEGQVL